MKLGAMHFWHVDIKPGKPVAFGTIEGTPVLVLPGNPGAVFACSQLLMVPALLKMHGRSFDETRSTAKLLQSVTGDAKRNVLQPVITSTDGVRPLPSGSSQLLGPFLDADTIAIIPPGGADMGTQVQTMSVTG
jgi:molybdopterin molybdotransferase